MVHANKSPLKIWENRERGRIEGLPNFFEVPPIISGMGKATNFKFGRYIQTIRANKSEWKIWEKMEHGCIQGLPKFFEYPLSGTDKATNFKFGRYVHKVHPSEQKPLKILGENGAWAYPVTAHIFWVPPIISGTDKATNFNFCTHILSIDRNKSPLQISGKVVRCVVRTLKTFQGTHILGASRGLLCFAIAQLSCPISKRSHRLANR